MATKRVRKILISSALAVSVVALAIGVFVRSHPLVFNESFFEHAHCIAQLGMGLRVWAQDHGGAFPTHTNGYCDALLLAWDEIASPKLMTGPGYSWKEFQRAHDNNTHLPESKGGRVYVQGLRDEDGVDQRIALAFDKLATPGGDHCHLFHRLTAPLGREVLFVDASHMFVCEAKWPEFARDQIERLVKANIPRSEAERLYSQARPAK